jgi:hypothetical protein
MSCFQVSNDHIGYLINLGQHLDIRCVVTDDGIVPISLHDEPDRRLVFTELLHANKASVSGRYGEPIREVGAEVPSISYEALLIYQVAAIVQALQWVRCYEYQSCDNPQWEDTFAYHYTQRLTSELIARIISKFPTSWTYDGPTLAKAS